MKHVALIYKVMKSMQMINDMCLVYGDSQGALRWEQ